MIKNIQQINYVQILKQQYELQAPKGIAIGFNEGPLFDKNIQQFQTQLNQGDSFVLYTDGWGDPEVMDEKDEEWGDAQSRRYFTMRSQSTAT